MFSLSIIGTLQTPVPTLVVIRLGDDPIIIEQAELIAEYEHAVIVEYDSPGYYIYAIRPKLFTIWIGHGSEGGVFVKGRLLSWEKFSHIASLDVGRDLVLACYSDRLSSYTKSVIPIGYGKVDAFFATYMALFVLTGKLRYLEKAFLRYFDLLRGISKPKYLLLTDGSSSGSSGGSNDGSSSTSNYYVIGKMSLQELIFHAVTIGIVIVETIMFKRFVPDDLKQTISDKIAAQLFINIVPTYYGMLTVFGLVAMGEMSLIDGLVAIIGYLFDFFGFLLTVVISWIKGRPPLEQYFWWAVLIANGVSKIVNPTGLLGLVLGCVPLIAALFAAALDYMDPGVKVGSD